MDNEHDMRQAKQFVDDTLYRMSHPETDPLYNFDVDNDKELTFDEYLERWTWDEDANLGSMIAQVNNHYVQYQSVRKKVRAYLRREPIEIDVDRGTAQAIWNEEMGCYIAKVDFSYMPQQEGERMGKSLNDYASSFDEHLRHAMASMMIAQVVIPVLVQMKQDGIEVNEENFISRAKPFVEEMMSNAGMHEDIGTESHSRYIDGLVEAYRYYLEIQEEENNHD